jgi:phosphotransferase system HPr (HPr) family protein
MTKDTAVSDEVIGDVKIGASSGLNALLARQVREVLQPFGSTATLRSADGLSADARNLLQILMLGARHGDRVTVRCVGPDAAAAHEVLVGTLQQRGGAR